MKTILSARNAKSAAFSLVVACSMASVIVACGKKSEENKKNSGAQYNGRRLPNGLEGKPLPLFDVRVPLGYGFNSVEESPTLRTCLEGTSDIVRVNRSEVNLNAEYTFDELQTKVNGGGGGGFSFGGFSMGGSAKYIEESRLRTNVMRFAFTASNLHHSKVFKTKARDALYAESANDEWTADCGDAYVAAQDFGSSLTVFVEVESESLVSSTSKGASGGGGFSGFGLFKANISGGGGSSKNQTKVSGKVNVSAFQVGGDPGALLKIFQGKDGESGAIAGTASCQLDAVKDKENKACLQLVTAIERYATVDFPSQLEKFNNAEDKAEKEGGPAIIASYVVRYPSKIFSDTNPFDRKLIDESRKNLAAYYQEEQTELNALAVKIGKKSSESLEALRDLMKENLEFIRKSSEFCFKKSTFDQCNTASVEAGERVSETQIPEGDEAAETAPVGE